jgi:hypothetical protein
VRRPDGRGARVTMQSRGPAGYAVGPSASPRAGSPALTSGSERDRTGSALCFFGGRPLVGAIPDCAHHGEGQHHQRDMPVPAVPGPGLVVRKPQLRLSRLERVASRPEEFHLRPLTERCGSLSAHTAPTKQPTASLPPRSPPVASWTLTTTAWPNPFAPAALPAFIARTGWSAPVLRIGTLASWWSPLGLLPWHRSDRFPQFHMRARIRLAPPLRRSPSAPYPGIRRTDPRGSRSLWF